MIAIIAVSDGISPAVMQGTSVLPFVEVSYLTFRVLFNVPGELR